MSEEFDIWVATFAQGCDQAPEGSAAMFGVDDGDDVLIGACTAADSTDSFLAECDQLLARTRKVAALATRVAWSPTEHGASSDAWALVIVMPDLPAFFGVRRLVEDDGWWRLEVEHVPWFMLSTASSLRAALVEGKPMTMKQVENDGLLRRPADEPHPVTDERGLL